VNKTSTCTTMLVTAAWLCLGSAVFADIGDNVKSCNGCHGAENLAKNNAVPSIAGLPEYYHSDQLHFYSDNERPCGEAASSSGEKTSMCAVAADLSDDQIDELAAHYAALPFVPAKQASDAALAAAGKLVHERDCAVCHSDGGSNAEDEAGILAGQQMGYLKMTIAEYRGGKREQPEPMQKKLNALSDDDVKALLNYYASQQ
jgi:cytochrome subunit of sulfide dehydrogenase